MIIHDKSRETRVRFPVEEHLRKSDSSSKFKVFRCWLTSIDKYLFRLFFFLVLYNFFLCAAYVFCVDLVTACSFCRYADSQLRRLRCLAALREAPPLDDFLEQQLRGQKEELNVPRRDSVNTRSAGKWEALSHPRENSAKYSSLTGLIQYM